MGVCAAVCKGKSPNQYIDDQQGEPAVDPNAEANKKEARGRKMKKKKDKFANEIGDDYTIYEKFTRIKRLASRKDIMFIIDSLISHFFFNTLLDDELEQVIYKMFYCSIPEGQYVFQQNDPASCFFIIHEGSVQVEINGEVKRELGSKKSFGELALMYNAPRSASIKTVKETKFWGIDRRTFRRVMEEVASKKFKENRKFIEEVKFFDTMTVHQKNSVAMVLLTQNYKKGEIIINEGDQAASYYIIIEGSAECVKNGQVIRVMKSPEAFGEQALYESATRTLTVRAQSDCKCISLSRGDLQSIMGAKILPVIQSNWSRWAIKNDAIFKNLTELQIEKWVKGSEFRKVNPGEEILPEGETLTKIVIVINGQLEYGSTNYEKGKVFDANFLFPHTNLSNLLQHPLKASSEGGEISVIDLARFQSITGQNLEEVFKNNHNSHEKKMLDDNKDFRIKVKDMTLNDLIVIKRLGSGQFGHVLLVREKYGTQFYALKAISKDQIVTERLENHTRHEKEVLELVNFPFIMKFYRTFRDSKFVYFLLSYVKGMELFDVIREIDLLNNEQSQFYIGSMILAVEYLHKKNIVYRDIKPENIMIDEKGYLKLIDMGTAKILKNENGICRTNTILGTPHYMAPEILKGKGYSLSVDLWSIGITLYEFLCGRVPFGEECEDPREVYELIQKQEVKYPKYFDPNANKLAKQLIEQLLNKIPDARLGGSYAALKAHRWFEQLDWDKLLDMEVKPPFVPTNLEELNAEIKQMVVHERPVIREMEEIIKQLKPMKSNGGLPVSADPNWDKDF